MSRAKINGSAPVFLVEDVVLSANYDIGFGQDVES